MGSDEAYAARRPGPEEGCSTRKVTVDEENEYTAIPSGSRVFTTLHGKRTSTVKSFRTA
jgi:hypothetical protein